MPFDWDVWGNFTDYQQAIAGGAVGAALAIFVFIAILLVLAVYVFHSLAWMTIAKKLKYKKAWLAWIPIAESAMRLQLGKFHWAWIFLILIPFLGWAAVIVLVTIATWRIFEKLKYPGWFALSLPLIFLPRVGGIGIILYLVAIGVVAWKKKR